MSRHRFVQRELDEYYDEQQYDDYYEEEEEDDQGFFDEEEDEDPFGLGAPQQESFQVRQEDDEDAKVAQITEFLGASKFSDARIRMALMQSNGSVDDAVAYLLTHMDQRAPVASSKQTKTQLEVGDIVSSQGAPSALGQFLQDEPAAPATQTISATEIAKTRRDEFDFSTPSPDDVAIAERAKQVTKRPDKKHKSSSKKTTSKTTTTTTKVGVSKQMQPHTAAQVRKRHEKRAALLAKREQSSETPQLQVCVIGHVDSGKSTLSGHLLLQQGQVDQRDMHRHQRDSAEMGKGSFALAWVMDQDSTERERGVTVDVARASFRTPNRRFALLDAPGHRHFVPSMISSVTQADAAILVVDATVGAFERGFEADGQTKEHAVLARALGVHDVVLAVNKMDAVQWDEERYQHVTDAMLRFLGKVGFKKSQVKPIPISGFHGDNLSQRGDTAEWYRGPTLMEVLDALPPPVRAQERDFRFCVFDAFREQSTGEAVTGRVESGSVAVGDRVLLLPRKEVVEIKRLYDVDSLPVDVAGAGDVVTLSLSHTMDDTVDKCVRAGAVLCSCASPVPYSKKVRVRLVMAPGAQAPLLKGSTGELFVAQAQAPCHVSKLIALLDKSTGDVLQTRPKCVLKGQSAVAELRLQEPYAPLACLRDEPSFGRFSLRQHGRTVAVGIVEEVLKALR